MIKKLIVISCWLWTATLMFGQGTSTKTQLYDYLNNCSTTENTSTDKSTLYNYIADCSSNTNTDNTDNTNGEDISLVIFKDNTVAFMKDVKTQEGNNTIQMMKNGQITNFDLDNPSADAKAPIGVVTKLDNIVVIESDVMLRSDLNDAVYYQASTQIQTILDEIDDPQGLQNCRRLGCWGVNCRDCKKLKDGLKDKGVYTGFTQAGGNSDAENISMIIFKDNTVAFMKNVNTQEGSNIIQMMRNGQMTNFDLDNPSDASKAPVAVVTKLDGVIAMEDHILLTTDLDDATYYEVPTEIENLLDEISKTPAGTNCGNSGCVAINCSDCVSLKKKRIRINAVRRLRSRFRLMVEETDEEDISMVIFKDNTIAFIKDVNTQEGSNIIQIMMNRQMTDFDLDNPSNNAKAPIALLKGVKGTIVMEEEILLTSDLNDATYYQTSAQIQNIWNEPNDPEGANCRRLGCWGVNCRKCKKMKENLGNPANNFTLVSGNGSDGEDISMVIFKDNTIAFMNNINTQEASNTIQIMKNGQMTDFDLDNPSADAKAPIHVLTNLEKNIVVIEDDVMLRSSGGVIPVVTGGNPSTQVKTIELQSDLDDAIYYQMPNQIKGILDEIDDPQGLQNCRRLGCWGINCRDCKKLKDGLKDKGVYTGLTQAGGGNTQSSIDKATLYNYLTSCSNENADAVMLIAETKIGDLTSDLTIRDDIFRTAGDEPQGYFIPIVDRQRGGGGGIKITTAPTFKYPDDFKKPEKSAEVKDPTEGTTIFFPEASFGKLASGQSAEAMVINGTISTSQLTSDGGGLIMPVILTAIAYPDAFQGKSMEDAAKKHGNMSQPGMDMANMMMFNNGTQNQQNQAAVYFINTANPAQPVLEVIKGKRNSTIEEMKTALGDRKGFIIMPEIAVPALSHVQFFKKGESTPTYEMVMLLPQNAKGDAAQAIFAESDQNENYTVTVKALPESTTFAKRKAQFNVPSDNGKNKVPLAHPFFDAHGDLLYFATKDGTTLTFYGEQASKVSSQMSMRGKLGDVIRTTDISTTGKASANGKGTKTTATQTSTRAKLL